MVYIKIQKAAKSYTCQGCGAAIAKGDEYVVESVFADNRPAYLHRPPLRVLKVCRVCNPVQKRGWEGWLR